jgi:zinc-ribbon domain
MEEQRCPQCNSPYAAESRFCKNCGAALAVGAPMAAQDVPTMVPAPIPPSPLVAPVAPVQPQNIAPAPYQQPIYQPVPQQPVQQNPYQQPYQQPIQQAPQYPYPQPVQQVNVVMSNNAAPVIVVSQKSVGIALLLTFLFGPLGMFYSTVSGAVIMLIVSIALAFITAGLSVFITWPICIIWGAVAASSHNKAIVSRL